MSAASKEFFCTVPFERMEVHPDGECFACCPGWIKMPIGSLASDTPVEGIWNGEAAREIRAGILDGSFRHCDETRCPHLASGTGHVVDRQAAREDPRLRAIIDEEKTVLAHGPLWVNASYDRSCNLSCPSCRVHTVVESGERLRHILKLQERFANEVLPSAKRLWITGTGDPFAAASFRDLLRQMDAADYPNLEEIWLHTNALLWTPENWARLRRIHHLIRAAEISIDAATPETYRINRRGGEFSVLLPNLEFISRLRIRVTVSFVVQANNFREMPSFVELARRFGFLVYFSKIFNWGTFTDDDYRERAVHLPEHPEHPEFLRLLTHPLLGAPDVRIGNLTALRLASEAPPPIAGLAASAEAAALRRLPIVG